MRERGGGMKRVQTNGMGERGSSARPICNRATFYLMGDMGLLSFFRLKKESGPIFSPIKGC